LAELKRIGWLLSSVLARAIGGCGSVALEVLKKPAVHTAQLKCARRNSAVPERDSSLFSHHTQHSAFSYVLGYHVGAPEGLGLTPFVPPSQPELSPHAHAKARRSDAGLEASPSTKFICSEFAYGILHRCEAGKNLGLEEETLESPSNPISQVLW